MLGKTPKAELKRLQVLAFANICLRECEEPRRPLHCTIGVFRLWYQTDMPTALRDVAFGAPHKHRLLVRRERGRTIH
jgi:hypothetical protein